MKNSKIISIILILLIIIQNSVPTGEKVLYFISAGELILIILLWRSFQKTLSSKEQLHIENGNSEDILQIMKVYRHDWQNHLQIILGYVSLKKYDQIPKYIGKITETAQKFSLISSFSNKELAVFLYMIPVRYPKLNYEFDIPTGRSFFVSNIYDVELLLSELRKFIDVFYKTVEINLTHLLIISLVAVDDNIIVTFEYEGDIKPVHEEIISLCEEYKLLNGKYTIDIYNNKEFMMELYFPL